MSIYEQGLDPSAVNHIALSPLSFIERTANVYPHYPAVIHGSIRRTWAQTYARCRRLASALAGRGIGKDDTVAVMLPNIPEMLEVHFGVPMIGAVLNPLNVRLDAEAIAFMLQHGEAKVLITDREFHNVIRAAIGMLDHPPLVIDVNDPEYGEGQAVSDLDYEALLAEGDPDFAWKWPTDEWQAISLNYTSGTTGNPKGVVYHHRGAYLNSLGNQMTWAMGNHPCTSGRCRCSIATAGATLDHHRNGRCACVPAPGRPAENPDADSRTSDHSPVRCTDRAQRPGEHAGIGESGHRSSGQRHGCRRRAARQSDRRRRSDGHQGHSRVWPDRNLRPGDVRLACRMGRVALDERAQIKSRQGVRYPTLEGVMVADSATLEPTRAMA
jgi:fatty-acyl-CoA synthase